MSGIKFYICDTETTGLKSNFNEMTEIGIIRYDDRVQLWHQIKCEYPERANFDALAITKKTMADLLKGLDKEKVVEECEKFLNEDGLTPAHRCFVCHNAPFDQKFLHALWASCGKEFPANLWLDTISLTKNFIKSHGEAGLNITKTPTGRVSTQLHACCDIVGVKKISEAHNAKVDSRNTYLLHKKLIEEKNVDYLPLIKTAVHKIESDNNSDDLINEIGLDPSLLDI